MQTDMRTDRDPFVAVVFLIALALAAPRLGVGQGPAARPDSASPAPAAAKDDAWYPEGLVRIRGKRYSLFVGASYTWFTSPTSRSRFGEGIWSPSFELYRPQRRGYSPIFEFNDTRFATDDSSTRVLAASVGVRYRPVDAERSRWFVLNLGVAAGPRVARISGRERTTVFGTSVQVGLEVLRTARATMRYETLPPVHGTRLSTLSLGTAICLPPYGRRGLPVESQDMSPTATCAPPGCAR